MALLCKQLETIHVFFKMPTRNSFLRKVTDILFCLNLDFTFVKGQSLMADYEGELL